MTTQKQKLFAYLDSMMGAGAGYTSADYESVEALQEEAQDLVSEQDGLTQGCGVGPLIRDIREWTLEMLAGKRDVLRNEPFCLQIKFDPNKHGFVLLHSKEELLAMFPHPQGMPDGYPVFARKIDTVMPMDVLCYLLYNEMAVVP